MAKRLHMKGFRTKCGPATRVDEVYRRRGLRLVWGRGGWFSDRAGQNGAPVQAPSNLLKT